MNITKKNTPNQYELDGEITAIVIHTTLGAIGGAVEWLMTSPQDRKKRTGKASYSSAHAVIGRLGAIIQLAPMNRATWHAGGVYRPSKRAKDVLPKTALGKLKNPNKSTIGIELASGYDIDKDGVLENWERQASPQQVKACAWYILNVIEPRTGKEFGRHNIITHRDIASHKPNMEVTRAMLITELQRQREKKEKEEAEVVPEIVITIEGDGEPRKYKAELIK